MHRPRKKVHREQGCFDRLRPKIFGFRLPHRGEQEALALALDVLWIESGSTRPESVLST